MTAMVFGLFQITFRKSSEPHHMSVTSEIEIHTLA